MRSVLFRLYLIAMAKRRTYANDATESVGLLLKIRLPWLILGLLLSLGTAVVVSRYETILSFDPRIAFFIPLIVYVSDAVGTQTATIYIRNLSKKQAKFQVYIIKELLFGLSVGLIFGCIVGLATNFWLHSSEIALAVGVAMVASITSASLLSLLFAASLNKLRIDPAIGVDPIVTVTQDVISLLIYFAVASFILL